MVKPASLLEAASIPAYVLTGEREPLDFEPWYWASPIEGQTLAGRTTLYPERTVDRSFARPRSRVSNPCAIQLAEACDIIRDDETSIERVTLARWHAGLSTIVLGPRERLNAVESVLRAAIPADAFFPEARWPDFYGWLERMSDELTDPDAVDAYLAADRWQRVSKPYRVATETACRRCGGTDAEIIHVRPSPPCYATACLRCNDGREFYEQRTLPELFTSADDAEDGWQRLNRRSGDERG